MAPTSITCWSKTAGAGGTENMRQGMLFSKNLRRQHERSGKACGPIRSRCRRGSGGRGTGELARCLVVIILSPHGKRKPRDHATSATPCYSKRRASVKHGSLPPPRRHAVWQQPVNTRNHSKFNVPTRAVLRKGRNLYRSAATDTKARVVVNDNLRLKALWIPTRSNPRPTVMDQCWGIDMTQVIVGSVGWSYLALERC